CNPIQRASECQEDRATRSARRWTKLRRRKAKRFRANFQERQTTTRSRRTRAEAGRRSDFPVRKNTWPLKKAARTILTPKDRQSKRGQKPCVLSETRYREKTPLRETETCRERS